MDETRLRGLLPGWLEMVRGRDLAEFLVTISHPDVVVRTPNGQVGGTQLIRDYTYYLRVAFPDLEMEVEHLGVVGDRVLLQFTLEGTHTGPFGFILPTQRVVKAPGALVARIGDDERIHELWAYLNMAVALLGQIDPSTPGIGGPFPDRSAGSGRAPAPDRPPGP